MENNHFGARTGTRSFLNKIQLKSDHFGAHTGNRSFQRETYEFGVRTAQWRQQCLLMQNTCLDTCTSVVRNCVILSTIARVSYEIGFAPFCFPKGQNFQNFISKCFACQKFQKVLLWNFDPKLSKLFACFGDGKISKSFDF